MTGLIIHTLRLRALDRMTVLRVPFREQPPDDSWFVGIGRSRGNPVAIFQAGATQYPVRLPYAPGEYFVREAWWEPPTITGKMLREGADTWPPVVYDADEDDIGREQWKEWGWKRRSSVHLPKKYARHILTLGPPVPMRLGEVDVSGMQNEGMFASLMQDPCDMAKQIKDKYREQWKLMYPKHTDPGTWTWGYPMEVRNR